VLAGSTEILARGPSDLPRMRKDWYSGLRDADHWTIKE
jgi:hypothetical protein